MTTAALPSSLTVTLLTLAACSSSSGGSSDSFASQMCAKLTGAPPSGCALNVTNCEAAYAALVLSSSCQGDLLNASCADLTASPVPPSLQSCLPPCSGGTMSCGASVTSATCNGDGTFTECNAGTTVVYTCSGVCSSESKVYSGTCGTSFNGQASPTGCPVCWCQ